MAVLSFIGSVMELPDKINESLAPFGGKPHFLCVAGSKLYGTARVDSDTDYRGFVETPAPYLLGRQKFEQAELNDGNHDVVIYSLQKFLSLLGVGSPNTIELLFVPDDLILISGDAFAHIRKNRATFITQDTVYPTIAFAKASWKRFIEKSSAKDAYHAIRLLIQAASMLQHREIKFPLEEYQRAMLVDFRNMEVTPSSIKTTEAVYITWLDWAEYLFNKKSLPAAIDKSWFDEMFFTLIDNELSKFVKSRGV